MILSYKRPNKMAQATTVQAPPCILRGRLSNQNGGHERAEHELATLVGLFGKIHYITSIVSSIISEKLYFYSARNALSFKSQAGRLSLARLEAKSRKIILS